MGNAIPGKKGRPACKAMVVPCFVHLSEPLAKRMVEECGRTGWSKRAMVESALQFFLSLEGYEIFLTKVEVEK
jgi:hypothetical protein